MLTVIKLEEAGFNSAMAGLAKSKKQPIANMPALAERLAFMDGGHNKFLEHIVIWCDVRAPRYWWQEADTYRLSSKQSESTMHTLINEIKDFDIDNQMHEVHNFMCANFEEMFDVSIMSDMILAAEQGQISRLKALLPEGFYQSRVWRFDYKCLRNIIKQRRDHKLPLWPRFIESLLDQVNHPKLLPRLREIPTGSGAK